jgi:hypothetical protein
VHFLRNLTGRLCALGWSVLLLAGCSATLQGPTGAAETRTVQLLEHGRHSSLLLTSSDATRVRYAYGDWAWYVEEDTGVISGGRALLRNSQAGLGRQRLGPEEPGRPLAAQIGIGIENIYRFDVPSDKVDALIRFLDAKFEQSDHEPWFSEARQLSFIPHPRPYTLGYNSNHMVADWLRSLDVDVQGNPALGRWRLEGGGVLE